jgi:hypothetical protein
MGIAFQGLGRKGGEGVAEGGPGRSPCMSESMRTEASSWPLWVRGQ